MYRCVGHPGMVGGGERGKGRRDTPSQRISIFAVGKNIRLYHQKKLVRVFALVVALVCALVKPVHW